LASALLDTPRRHSASGQNDRAAPHRPREVDEAQVAPSPPWGRSWPRYSWSVRRPGWRVSARARAQARFGGGRVRVAAAMFMRARQRGAASNLPRQSGREGCL